MAEEAPTVETRVLSTRHAAPDSHNAEARGLTMTQDKKYSAKATAELLRPMRDASESAKSADIRSRTDIKRSSSWQLWNGSLHNLRNSTKTQQNSAKKLATQRTGITRGHQIDSGDHHEKTSDVITEAIHPAQRPTRTSFNLNRYLQFALSRML